MIAKADKEKKLLITERNPVEFYAFKLKEWEKFLQDKSTDELKKIHRKLYREFAKQFKILEGYIKNLDVLEKYLKEKGIKSNPAEKEQKVNEIKEVIELIKNNKEYQIKVLQKNYRKKLKAS